MSSAKQGYPIVSRLLARYFSSRRRHTRCGRDWSSDVCSSDLPKTVSFWALRGLAEQVERAGLDGTPYRLRYQQLMAMPVLLAAVVLVASFFSLRLFRMGGVQRMVSGGVGAGFVLYVATKVVGDLGGVGVVSPMVAGGSPAFVGCLFGVYVLLHQEDG